MPGKTGRALHASCTGRHELDSTNISASVYVPACWMSLIMYDGSARVLGHCLYALCCTCELCGIFAEACLLTFAAIIPDPSPPPYPFTIMTFTFSGCLCEKGFSL